MRLFTFYHYPNIYIPCSTSNTIMNIKSNRKCLQLLCTYYMVNLKKKMVGTCACVTIKRAQRFFFAFLGFFFVIFCLSLFFCISLQILSETDINQQTDLRAKIDSITPKFPTTVKNIMMAKTTNLTTSTFGGLWPENFIVELVVRF